MKRKRGSQEPGLVYMVFVFKYDQLILFLILIEKFNHESNFQVRLAWTLTKSQIGPKRGEKVVVKGHGWYYTISIYKNYQLTFLLYLGSLTKSQNFIPIGLNWPYKSRIGPKGEKTWFLRAESCIT